MELSEELFTFSLNPEDAPKTLCMLQDAENNLLDEGRELLEQSAKAKNLHDREEYNRIQILGNILFQQFSMVEVKKALTIQVLVEQNPNFKLN